jgi:hypothetical protein
MSKLRPSLINSIPATFIDEHSEEDIKESLRGNLPKEEDVRYFH